MLPDGGSGTTGRGDSGPQRADLQIDLVMEQLEPVVVQAGVDVADRPANGRRRRDDVLAASPDGGEWGWLHPARFTFEDPQLDVDGCREVLEPPEEAGELPQRVVPAGGVSENHWEGGSRCEHLNGH